MRVMSSDLKDQNVTRKSKLEVKYRAFYLSLEIIKFIESLPYKISLKIISDQLIRSVTSIGANIVEAKASSSRKEFVNYFQISLKSSFETKYWLALLREVLPDDKFRINKYILETEEICKILSSSVLTIKGHKKI
jgi:four helix bundle protein